MQTPRRPPMRISFHSSSSNTCSRAQARKRTCERGGTREERQEERLDVCCVRSLLACAPSYRYNHISVLPDAAGARNREVRRLALPFAMFLRDPKLFLHMHTLANAFRYMGEVSGAQERRRAGAQRSVGHLPVYPSALFIACGRPSFGASIKSRRMQE